MESAPWILLTSLDNPYVTEVGGKHIHLLLLERGLKLLGAQVATLYYIREKSRASYVRNCLLKLLPMHLRYVVTYRDMMDYLEDNFPLGKFDLINAHDVLSLLAIRSRAQRRILTVHGYFARESIAYLKHVKDKARIKTYHALLRFESESLHYADHIIAVDSRLKRYLVSDFGFPKDKIAVVHNAVDTERFQPVPQDEQDRLRKRMGYSERDSIVLVPRRLVEKNGVVHAVKAMKHIGDQNLHMIVAGEGPEKEKVIEERQGDKRIHLLGSIPHRSIDAYFKAADIVLIPSITAHSVQEASSIAMLEGMSCGKTVICSNIGGMREIIRSMENGILFEEKNSIAIANAIETAIGDQALRNTISAKARTYVEQNHSFLAHARKIYEIYTRVLREK